jgi:hypothetical protein
MLSADVFKISESCFCESVAVAEQAVSDNWRRWTPPSRRKTRVQAGERSNLDVLVAETQLYTTRRDLSTVRYQLLASRLRLLSYTGQLADDDIERISAWFETRAELGGK